MTSMMGCDENRRNMINPYTETGTFGTSWNGGYHPDDTLEYIRPFDNKIPSGEGDDFIPPMYITPPNIYFKTQEARRENILEGGIPARIYEDRVCEHPDNILQNPPQREMFTDGMYPVVDTFNGTNLLLFGLVVAVTIFLISLKK